MSDDVAGRDPASSGSEPGNGLEALTEEVLPTLIARLRASRLGELEVRSGDWRVRLRRDVSTPARAATAGGPAGSFADDTELAGSVARSPAVGYFNPAPDLVAGRPVRSGDVLGSIDVLGIVQEVSAPGGGIISRVLAEEGQAVEYGQALADIDPLQIDDYADDEAPEVAG